MTRKKRRHLRRQLQNEGARRREIGESKDQVNWKEKKKRGKLYRLNKPLEQEYRIISV